MVGLIQEIRSDSSCLNWTSKKSLVVNQALPMIYTSLMTTMHLIQVMGVQNDQTIIIVVVVDSHKEYIRQHIKMTAMEMFDATSTAKQVRKLIVIDFKKSVRNLPFNIDLLGSLTIAISVKNARLPFFSCFKKTILMTAPPKKAALAGMYSILPPNPRQ